MMPISLDFFPDIWSFHVSLLSIITPKKVVFAVSSIGSLSIFIYILEMEYRLFVNIIRCVFLTFRDNLSTLSHVDMLRNVCQSR